MAEQLSASDSVIATRNFVLYPYRSKYTFSTHESTTKPEGSGYSSPKTQLNFKCHHIDFVEGKPLSTTTARFAGKPLHCASTICFIQPNLVTREVHVWLSPTEERPFPRLSFSQYIFSLAAVFDDPMDEDFVILVWAIDHRGPFATKMTQEGCELLRKNVDSIRSLTKKNKQSRSTGKAQVEADKATLGRMASSGDANWSQQVDLLTSDYRQYFMSRNQGVESTAEEMMTRSLQLWGEKGQLDDYDRPHPLDAALRAAIIQRTKDQGWWRVVPTMVPAAQTGNPAVAAPTQSATSPFPAFFTHNSEGDHGASPAATEEDSWAFPVEDDELGRMVDILMSGD